MKKQAENLNLDVLRDFTSNLRKAVSATELTPYALAKKLGLDKAAIKNMMSGRRDFKFSTAVKAVKGMGISMDGLLGIAPEKKTTGLPPDPASEANLPYRFSLAEMDMQDAELLGAIAKILKERRTRTVVKLIKAAHRARQSRKNNGETLTAKTPAAESAKGNGLSYSFDEDAIVPVPWEEGGGDAFEEFYEDDYEKAFVEEDGFFEDNLDPDDYGDEEDYDDEY